MNALRWITAAACGLVFLIGQIQSQTAPKVNADSLVAKDFTDRVAAYLSVRKKADANVPALKPTSSADAIAARQKALGQEIKTAREHAKQGEIFTPEIAALFRKLLSASFSSAEGAKVRASLRHAEPVKNVRLVVNEEYPATVPLQSTPSSLLQNLPQLPKEVEYRIVGHDLVLLDVGTNLIVDITPGVVPSSEGG